MCELLFSNWEHPQRCGSCSLMSVGAWEGKSCRNSGHSSVLERTGVSFSHSLLEMSPSKVTACPQPFVSSSDAEVTCGVAALMAACAWCQQWQNSLLWALSEIMGLFCVWKNTNRFSSCKLSRLSFWRWCREGVPAHGMRLSFRILPIPNHSGIQWFHENHSWIESFNDLPNTAPPLW